MELVEAIKSRRSVRRFTDKSVDDAIVQELIELAAWAPSASNQQPWGFLVLKDKDELKSLSEQAKKDWLADMDRYPHMHKYRKIMEDENYNIFHNAGTVIVIYGNTDTAWYIYDCSLAAQNLMLAAHDRGLGTCWIGFAHRILDTPEFKEKYNIPKKYSVVAPLILGYPEKEPGDGPPRKELLIFSS
ncbi:nitroreductase family protein [Desulfofalx alkaliphila]|uniref:nitroreductase family protein n=1 Tax=Desulfofalx alkaliphila TaxID=105483 RepID=UPI0004E17433|nr:nitroreductase [Desulfofalx alkaliphila]